MSKTTPELPVAECPTVDELENWVDAHHDAAEGAWVKVAKTGTDTDWIGFDEALNVALCFGWTNSVRRELDRDYYLQKFVPRQPEDYWTWIECDKSEWLIEQGRMRPEGIAQVEAAKADGRWERAYEARGEITVPTDLRARLASYPEAKAFFETLEDRNRNPIIARLGPPLDPQARTQRLDQIITTLLNREIPYPTGK
ncbi:YdeI/OmpD-associated family protein [soil metagenome]